MAESINGTHFMTMYGNERAARILMVPIPLEPWAHLVHALIVVA